MFATIISYCTNDFRFIDRCIQEARLFSSQIIVAVCDHFFDGTPENRLLLAHTYAAHPDCTFVEFSYLPHRIYSRFHAVSPQDEEWAIYWAATTRYVGWHFLKPEIEWVYFLDSDEVVEGKEFAEWLEQGSHLQAEAHRFATYLYALRAIQRAKKITNATLLVKRETLAPLTLFNPLERIGAYQVHPGPKGERRVSLKGMPMVHHYSWVRTQEECLQKTRTWGHRHDQDWPKLIEETFQGTAKQLFDLDLEFEEIEAPYFDPLSVSLPKKPVESASFPHVYKIDDKQLFQRELQAWYL